MTLASQSEPVTGGCITGPVPSLESNRHRARMPSTSTRLLEPRSLITACVLAVAYFLAAKASLLLAIPPGYASAVWPPSGIALAALLLYGGRVWPGVWVGALLANFAVNPSLGLAAAIATGNTLEAVVAMGLAQRFLRFARVPACRLGVPLRVGRRREQCHRRDRRRRSRCISPGRSRSESCSRTGTRGGRAT